MWKWSRRQIRRRERKDEIRADGQLAVMWLVNSFLSHWPALPDRLFLYVRLKFSRLGFPWEAKNEIDCGIGGNFWKKVGDISDQRQLSFMEVVLHGFISIPGKVNFPVSLGSKLLIWPRFILKTKQWNAWSCERSLKVFCPNLTVNEAKSDRCEVYIDLNHSSSSS